MNAEYAVYYTLALLICYGIYLACFGELKENIRGFAFKAGRAISKGTHSFDVLFRRAGLPIRLIDYKLIRAGVCLLIILMAVILGIRADSTMTLTTGIFAAYFLFTISTPTQTFFNTRLKSPFMYLMGKAFVMRGKRYDDEIFNSFVILKNLAVVQKEKPRSADYILELLMENSGRLKNIYTEMLSIYRSEEPERAFGFFAENIGTKSAKSLAIVLAKLDSINPHELLEQIRVSQDAISEQRYTEASKRAERNGIISIGFSTGTFFVILLNFVVVVVIMDTLAMLGSIV
ncbi:MAG: hypothetical protein GX663_09925 [Clostridiales bacterium]|nr:hypothetical protein [Clostridiales bacterium]